MVGNSFNPVANVLYVGICKSGRDKDKEVRALLCTQDSIQEVTIHDDYEMYSSHAVVPGELEDVGLDLYLKDSTNVISVGVPEGIGDEFPVSNDYLPLVFSLN